MCFIARLLVVTANQHLIHGIRIHLRHLHVYHLQPSPWHSGSVLARNARGRGFEFHRVELNFLSFSLTPLLMPFLLSSFSSAWCGIESRYYSNYPALSSRADLHHHRSWHCFAISKSYHVMEIFLTRLDCCYLCCHCLLSMRPMQRLLAFDKKK